ncbi:VOC family protein [Nocardiopsis sediminis]|uniref:VOC family protein n=1 Tax=Nocardiopsis sediminis TaxID=1778267 RepID=A0ABV8FUR3_9ACTN
MATKIFVNLPVKDLKTSVDFFTALGFSFNPQFTDENATCMIIGDEGFVMLLVRDYFSTFTPKPVADPGTHTGVIIALSADSRADVDALADKALASGGSFARDPQDHGFMYARSFQDPDGHIWESVWMDPAAIQG